MTTTELRPTWSERLNPRNWTLAWKLIAIGLVPALLALALGVLRIADQADAAASLGAANRLLEVRGQVAAAADALRQERDEATILVAGGRADDRGVLDIAVGQTDAAVEAALGGVRGAESLDGTTRSALDSAESGLSQIGSLRTDVGSGPTTDTDAVISRYTTLVAQLDGLDRALLRQVRTPDGAGLVDALTSVTSASEQLALQHTVLGAAIRGGQLRPEAVTASVAADNRLGAEYADYRSSLTPEQLSVFGTFDDGVANSDRERVKAQILGTPADRPVVVDPAAWDAAYATALTAAQGVAERISTELAAAGVRAEEAASNLAGINSVILMLGLLVGIAIAVLIARALLRSLKVLRTSALDVAERRLPLAVSNMRSGESPDVSVEPVPLTTRDEVGQVARAFDAVHGQAVRLAADQAALQNNVSSMFVNLSRRSQALVERQLQLIEQLESNEQDPDQLSNLFQLDHLATRMRRNSENLLVLAGTDLAKRNIAPVPMVDVLRAAVSEIEQYQRIVVQAPPNASILGRAASDLVHLLAELLDNATNFSPPDSQVVMSTTRTPDGSIVVEIADRGVGMVEHELADANQRLGGPSSVDVSASRRMGLFVVGRLGTRHGIGVQLSSSTASAMGTGLTASVTVPGELVPVADGEAPRVPRPEPAVVEAAPRAQLAAAPAAEHPDVDAPMFDVPPQRVSANGHGRTGSLSSLVAGADGPPSPVVNFDGDAPRNGSTPPFPPAGGVPAVAPPPLPTRRPGSSLSPNGFGPPVPPGGEPPHPDVAEQARQDQLAAEQRAHGQDTWAGDVEEPETTAFAAVPPSEADERSRHALAEAPDADPADDELADRHGADDGYADDGYAEQGEEHPAPAEAVVGEAADDTHAQDPEDEDTDGQAVAEVADEDSRDGHAPDEHTADEHASDEQPDGSAVGPALAVGAAGTAAAALAHGAAGPDRDDPEADEQDVDGPRADQPVTNGQVTNGQVTHGVHGSGAFDRAPAAPPSPNGAGPNGSGPNGVGPLPQRRPSPGRGAGAPRPRPLDPAPATTPMPAVGHDGHPVRPDAAPVDRGPAEQGPDGLFAPSVPVVDEPVAPSPDRPPGFDMGETTPIFEEIASAWFRSNRALPVDYEDDAPATPAAPAPRPTPQARPRPAELPVRRPAVAPTASPVSAAPAAESGFASAADDGWRAAESVPAAADRSDELTAAGLPKRRPRARLVPGSAGSAVLAPPASPARSAESVRGRLASYQQGVRQGRESRLRGDGSAPPESAHAGGNHDEERS